MARLLIVDDDENLRDVLSMYFADEGFAVVEAQDGQDALEQMQNNTVDLIISDVNMPGVDGFSLCRKLRAAGQNLPIILLTSRDSEIDEALGLELGADDYMSKPFSNRVLLARVRALLRRAEFHAQTGHQAASENSANNTPATSSESWTRGPMQLDSERLQIKINAQPISTTLTEFRLVEALSRRPGLAFSRAKLLDLIRGDDSVVADRIIDTYVRRLRQKFAAVDPDYKPIETLVGLGYKWREVD